MATDHPCVTEPLLVRPAMAWRMLGCGNTFGYALVKRGELESFLDGRARTSPSRRSARTLRASLLPRAQPVPRRNPHCLGDVAARANCRRTRRGRERRR